MRVFVILSLILLPLSVFADDGPMFRKNVSKTPDLETEHAALRMLPVYVPAQASDGTLLTEGIEYYDADGTLVDTRFEAKPLILHYTDGHVETIDEDGYGGFPGHGHRDAYAAVSLDDGATWQRTNLSNSGDLSSFSIREKRKWVPYPGDVGRSAMASDGNQVLVVWVSRYALGGSPNYAMEDGERNAVATYLGLDVDSCTDGSVDGGLIDTPCLYLEDHFGVSGSQGSSDLADEGFPLVGILPYAAVWVARGVILPPNEDRDTSKFVWFKAERLSSAVRDANRPEAVCVKGAGCVVTWQEDPDGIRPGEGEGPGEGWSGAIAHHQTDTWYSYISWDNFGLVSGDAGYGSLYDGTGDLADWVDVNDTGTPKAAIPMSIPVRLTDNAMCTHDELLSDDPYCYADFDGSGTADFCADWVAVTIETPEGPTQEVNMCITEDGRLMRGNTAATRARLGLHGYSTKATYGTDTFFESINSAWFSMAYEENKGLGEEGENEEVPEDFIDKVDMGKNVWYHTFDMFNPELVSQGLMLNQPAVYQDDFSNPEDFLTKDTLLGYNFYQIVPDPVYETLAGLTTDPNDPYTVLYQSEISRRPSPITQDWYDAGSTGTVALQLWKQGIIRRGGPADIMGRRFVIPSGFNSTTDNPYDYANMDCETWAFSDGSNPRYVKGLCASPAINLSGNTVLTADSCSSAASCLEDFPFNEYFDDFDTETDSVGLAKIWTWQQFDSSAPTPFETNFDDQSWENPYDVAKGHRGFMIGDMILAMYAWSPNWQANTVGHDNYNLYARRSFDGGVTWTTTPADLGGVGTTTCEWMGPAGTDTEDPICTEYAAGEFEQARNLSQLVGTRETILDPRYSPTTRSITATSVATLLPVGFSSSGSADDTRDPSRFFMVYETGDNTTVAYGEAEPLDLFYSRAVNWGDHYLVWQDDAAPDACFPSADNTALVGFCNEFDPLEGAQLSLSGEGSITASPGGSFFYAAWNQEDLDKEGYLIGSDAWFRRVQFIDDYVPGDDTPEDDDSSNEEEGTDDSSTGPGYGKNK